MTNNVLCRCQQRICDVPQMDLGIGHHMLILREAFLAGFVGSSHS